MRSGSLDTIRKLGAAWDAGERERPDMGPFVLDDTGCVLSSFALDDGDHPTREAWETLVWYAGVSLQTVDWFAVLANLLGHVSLWAVDARTNLRAEEKSCLCPEALRREVDRLFDDARSGRTWSLQEMLDCVARLPVVPLPEGPRREPKWMDFWRCAWLMRSVHVGSTVLLAAAHESFCELGPTVNPCGRCRASGVSRMEL